MLPLMISFLSNLIKVACDILGVVIIIKVIIITKRSCGLPLINMIIAKDVVLIGMIISYTFHMLLICHVGVSRESLISGRA